MRNFYHNAKDYNINNDHVKNPDAKVDGGIDLHAEQDVALSDGFSCRH